MEGRTGSAWRVLLTGDDSGHRIAVVEIREQRWAEPPRHVHSREDELIYVLEGQVTVDRDGKQLDCPAGTSVFLPRGSEHCHSVDSADARMLVVFMPAGLEGYFEELSRPAAERDGFQDIEWLATVAARYGIAITGPGRCGEQ